ncbi:unnamed protein product, partial [Brassica oleracea]
FLSGSQNGDLRFAFHSGLPISSIRRERELEIEAARTWVCEKTKSLVSDTIGVSFPIKDGIPCLVPKDGKILEEDGDASKAS